MKTLIVGRSGTGKDKLRQILTKKYGWNFEKSYSTRKKRHPDDASYDFLTTEEAATIPDTDKYLKTANSDGEYFTTKAKLEQSDGMVIDPKGVYEIIKDMPDTLFEIVYLVVPDVTLRKEHSIDRADDKETAAAIFDARNTSENDMFTKFEQKLTRINEKNCSSYCIFENDYEENTIENLAATMNARKQMYHNLLPIVQQCAAEHIINVTDNGEIIVVMKSDSEDGYRNEFVTPEGFVQILLSNNEGFTTVLKSYLALSSTSHASKPYDTHTEYNLWDYVFGMVRAKTENNTETSAQSADDVNTYITAHVCDNLSANSKFLEMLDTYISDEINAVLKLHN